MEAHQLEKYCNQAYCKVTLDCEDTCEVNKELVGIELAINNLMIDD